MSSSPDAKTVTPRPASIEKLTASIVDYAGLFPPAALDMGTAVARYAESRVGVGSWMLGSFVVPLQRCDAFEEAAEQHRSAGDSWSASVILTRDAVEEADRLRSLRDRWQGRIEIGSVEIAPLRSRAHVASVADALPRDLATFYEVQLGDEQADYLKAIAEVGGFAKVRAGGVDAAAFPNVLQVAEFLEQAESLGVPFKATAGLHHLMRGPQPITYESDSPSVWMHGYLNLLLAAALVHAGKARGSELVEVLSESCCEAFVIAPKSISWRDRVITLPEIERCRRAFFQSFGSCSFQEPLSELEELVGARVAIGAATTTGARPSSTGHTLSPAKKQARPPL